MNYIGFLKKLNVNEPFKFLYTHFLPTLATYDYLVDWKKVEQNKLKYEIQLNILNTLFNRKNFKKTFFEILKKYPEVIESFPILLATRDKEITFIKNQNELEFEYYKFQNTTDNIKKYYDFFEKTGLKSLFTEQKITNLVDYVFGVEVGLNSNARKNRTGKIMENIVKNYLNNFCKKHQEFSFISQATQNKIKEKFNKQIKIDKSNRRFDFALYNTKKDKLFLIEVNFYNGGGSKLKATAGEYKQLNDFLKQQNIPFIWITDGKGWFSALRALEETFNHNDYVINLYLLKLGILEYICI